jgi:hypothetical protein
VALADVVRAEYGEVHGLPDSNGSPLTRPAFGIALISSGLEGHLQWAAAMP